MECLCCIGVIIINIIIMIRPLISLSAGILIILISTLYLYIAACVAGRSSFGDLFFFSSLLYVCRGNKRLGYLGKYIMQGWIKLRSRVLGTPLSLLAGIIINIIIIILLGGPMLRS